MSRRQLKHAPLGWAILGLVAAVTVLLLYGYLFGRWNLAVKEVSYEHKDIPAAFDGMRIVHISDFHLNTFDGWPSQLERFVSRINDLKPDMICFTGDLVTIGYQEAEPYEEALSSLSSRYGIYSVLGNHDFLLYDRRFRDEEQRLSAVDSLVNYQRDTLGWSLLRNSSKRIEAPDGSCITVIGLENGGFAGNNPATKDKGELAVAMEGTDGFRIILFHDPIHWDSAILPYTDIPLSLSGHTHAGQIRLFGWAPATILYPRTYGRYDENGQTMYVNPGLGCTALPFRIGARPEITVITLHRAE